MGIPETNPTAPKAVNDSTETTTPEDVATLYSWANLHGAKYRDFSASRAVAREEARLRVEAAQEEERRRQQEEAERIAQEEAQIAARLAAEAAEEARQAEAERLAEISRQAEVERQAVLAAQEAQRQATQQRSWQPGPVEEYPHPTGLEFGAPSFAAANSYADLLGDPSEQMPMQPFADFPSYPAIVPTIPAAYPAAGQDNPLSRFAPQGDLASFDPQPPAFANSPLPGASSPDPFAKHSQAYPGVPSAFSEFEPALGKSPFTALSDSEKPYRSSAQETLNQSPWHFQSSREEAPELGESRDFAAGPAWLAAESSHAVPPLIVPQQTQASIARPSFAENTPPRSDTPRTPQGQVPMYSQAASQYAPKSQASQGTLAQSFAGNPPSGYPNPSSPSELLTSRPAEDTLTGSRDRIASRWFALKGVFDPQSAPIEQAPAQPPAHVPALAVFSLAGGVGKTSLVASLGRALSSRGERVLLVDTAAFGLLPFYFGARDQRPGLLRTFNPPGVSVDAPIQVVTIDPDGHSADHSGIESSQGANQPNQPGHPDWLAEEVVRYTRSANRLLIDLPTASGSTTRRILRLSPVVLVPVLADMNSVVSVGAIESFFRNNAGSYDLNGKPILPYYVLNQFDYSLPLHLDVREILRERIGDRLLPFALRRSPAVSEALAEGMTVMDYAPTAVIAEDYANLASWVRSLSAPASQTYRGVRWSER